MYDETIQTNGEQIRKTNETPSPFAAGMLYLTVLLLMLLSSLLTARINTQGDRYYYYMFLLQLATIGLPTIGYLIFRKKNIEHSLRLGKANLAEILLSIGMAVFGYGAIVFINLLWIIFLSKFGSPQPAPIPPIESGKHYLMAIVVIGATPAVLEEFMFRGVMQRGYERYGKKISIIFTGILFAFLHMSIVTIPAIIFLGILLCYIAYRANSVWVSITYHFINNTIAITLAYISNLITDLIPMDVEGMSGSLADLPPGQLRMMVIVWAFLGFVALILFGACFAGFHIVTRGKQEELPARVKEKPGSLLHLILPIVLAALIIAAMLVFEVIHMVNPAPIL